LEEFHLVLRIERRRALRLADDRRERGIAPILNEDGSMMNAPPASSRITLIILG